MKSIRLKKPHFGLYTHYATGTITRPGLPLSIEAHGFGNGHAEAIEDALRLAAKVKH